jgi:hypothetical protein
MIMWGANMHAQRNIDTTGLVQIDCDTVLTKLSPFFAQKGERYSMRTHDNQVHVKDLENSNLVYTSDDGGYWTHELNDGRLAIGIFKQIDYKGLFLSFRLKRVKWVQCHMRGYWLFFNANSDLEAVIEFGANSYPRKCWCAS